MKDPHKYLLLGLIGIVIQALIAYDSRKKDAVAANLHLTFVQFLRNDWVPLALSATAVVAWFFLFADAVSIYPKIQNFVRFAFLVMGAMGNYILLLLLGKTKTWIRKTVDTKTDELDAIKTEAGTN